MGLVTCLVSFVLGFVAVLGVVTQMRSEIIDPEGAGGIALPVVLIALCALSALFGARHHQRWLAEHLKSAALCGAAAGIVNGSVILVVGVVSTWAAGPVIAVLFFVARFTFIVWPAFIVHGTIAAARRREVRI